MMYSFSTFSVFLKFWLKWVFIMENSQEKFQSEVKSERGRIGKYLESWVLPSLVQFANLLHRRKPKFINN